MEHYKILFEHEHSLEDYYGIESAWALFIEQDLYKLDNILFYALGYSLGDVVRVEDRDGALYVTDLVEPSGHSTVRILFPDVSIVESTRNYLSQLDCKSEGSDVPFL